MSVLISIFVFGRECRKRPIASHASRFGARLSRASARNDTATTCAHIRKNIRSTPVAPVCEKAAKPTKMREVAMYDTPTFTLELSANDIAVSSDVEIMKEE